jgi:hypothetical protein
MPFMSTSIDQLSQMLQQLLIEDANCIGRESGFIQRQRKLSGSSFAQTLVFGWQSNPNASLEELCQSACNSGVRISPQGLQERLNSPQANEFLYRLLMRGLSYLVTGESADMPLLDRFTGVYLQDSSKIKLPEAFSHMWAGHGQAGHQAVLKIQTVYDYKRGGLDLSLASGRDHDCPLQTTALEAGSLRLADVAYFKIKVFEELNDRGVYWLSRLPARVGIWQNDQVIHILDWLQLQGTDCIDQSVELSGQRFSCRLIAVRVPEDVAQDRRKRVRESAKARKKSRLQQSTLDLCDWTIMVTNLRLALVSIEEALRLLRLRWQIELLFKLWKQHLSLDDWRSNQPCQILSEVYAKLLTALIQHWFCVLGCWQELDRSLVKACFMLQKHVSLIHRALPQLTNLIHVLASLLPALARCKVQKRKSRPATFQLLDLDTS